MSTDDVLDVARLEPVWLGQDVNKDGGWFTHPDVPNTLLHMGGPLKPDKDGLDEPFMLSFGCNLLLVSPPDSPWEFHLYAGFDKRDRDEEGKLRRLQLGEAVALLHAGQLGISIVARTGGDDCITFKPIAQK